jgi:hypothetical protein
MYLLKTDSVESVGENIKKEKKLEEEICHHCTYRLLEKYFKDWGYDSTSKFGDKEYNWVT